jgi:hypothetical protein
MLTPLSEFATADDYACRLSLHNTPVKTPPLSPKKTSKISQNLSRCPKSLTSDNYARSLRLHA